ncbi:hypothetical protein EV426DRAFT_575538 [Tirmania nivea]|nr:hypothetical protein EV426DRAFT_575538 [Tirmania nivea]
MLFTVQLINVIVIAVFQQDINTKDDKYGQTPLTWVAVKGHEAKVRLLLERNDMEVNAKDDEYDTYYYGQLGMDTRLSAATNRRNNVDVDAKDKDDPSPLSCVTKNGHEACTENWGTSYGGHPQPNQGPTNSSKPEAPPAQPMDTDTDEDTIPIQASAPPAPPALPPQDP